MPQVPVGHSRIRGPLKRPRGVATASAAAAAARERLRADIEATQLVVAGIAARSHASEQRSASARIEAVRRRVVEKQTARTPARSLSPARSMPTVFLARGGGGGF